MKTEETRGNVVQGTTPATPATSGEERKKVVINLFADEKQRAEEAAALTGRQTAAKEAADRANTANETATDARNLATQLMKEANTADMNLRRSRFAAGLDTADDRSELSQEQARQYGSAILAAAFARLEAIEEEEETKKANKQLRDEQKKTGLFRALRDVKEMLDLYNATLEPYDVQLKVEDLTPDLCSVNNLSPFLLAPTKEGTLLAAMPSKTGRPAAITDWNAPKLIRLVKLNKLLKDAATDAPAAALLNSLKARRAAADARALVTQLEETRRQRATRARALKATAANPKMNEKTRAAAAEQLATLTAEIHNYDVKIEKAKRDAATAEQTAATLRTLAAQAAGATPEALAELETADDARELARTANDDAQRTAASLMKKARTAAAAAAKQQKKTIKEDAKPATLAKYAPDETAAALEAKKTADRAAATLEAATTARAEAMKQAATADPAAEYLQLLKIAAEAMKQAADAKKKAADARATLKTAKADRDKAAPVNSGISDAELLKKDEALQQAQADAAAAKEEADAAQANAAGILAQLADAAEDAAPLAANC